MAVIRVASSTIVTAHGSIDSFSAEQVTETFGGIIKIGGTCLIAQRSDLDRACEATIKL